ncbi:MAG: hypothetical protein OXG39_15750 [Chloroflexi bacterium]|nr:hypothetical protein [Chloroflexota bacterium]
MRPNPHHQFRLLALALIALLAVAACRPVDTLDITPSPTPTPEPTATPSPTPPPADFIDPYEVNSSIMERLITLLPDPLPAVEEWKRVTDSGTAEVRNIRGIRRPAIGRAIPYTTQQGSSMLLNFIIFADEAAAAAEFERKRGLRSADVDLEEDAAFRTPNAFGSGLYGSFALFKIDNYFVEVYVEIFTTSVSPLELLASETIKFFERNRSSFEAAADDNASLDAGSVDVLEAVLDNMPNEIITTTQWKRDYSRFDEGVDTPRNIQNGRAIRVAYVDQMANNFQMTFGQFDSADDAMAHYEKIKGIREGIEEENSIEDFPKPHVLGRGLYGSVALFAIDEFFLEVLMERAPGTSANPTEAIARKALAILEAARGR